MLGKKAVKIIFASAEGKPHISSTQGNGASGDGLSGRTGRGYLPPAVAKHTPM